MPDRILLTWNGDAAHSQAISWRTTTAVKRSYCEYAVATEGPYFVQDVTRRQAATKKFGKRLSECHLHNLQLTDLRPSTRYAYRVGDGKNWSEWFHFSTASEKPEPFSFIYFGDAQNDVRSLWSRIVREAHADAPRAAFMVHAGDLVNSANRDAEWGEWFDGGDWLNAMIPSIATPGNHEYAKRKYMEDGEEKTHKELSRYWRAVFDFPKNGPEGLSETVYWLDYQGVRIISLNSNEQEERQVKWLDGVLSSNPNKWTIVTFHHPLFSSAKGRDNVGLRKLWKPILDKHRVDLVLQGHDHTYARSGLELPEDVENVESGITLKRGPTVYVVSVSGPKQYDVGDRKFFQRSASGAQLYQVLKVDGDTLQFEARVANGKLYDAFELRKKSGEFNELVDLTPPTKELRKPSSLVDIDTVKSFARKLKNRVKDGAAQLQKLPMKLPLEPTEGTDDEAASPEK